MELIIAARSPAAVEGRQKTPLVVGDVPHGGRG